MSDQQEPPEVRDSQPNASGPQRAAGGMGISSEREGPTGPGQHGTDGVRPTFGAEPGPDELTPPEQSAGSPEQNPADIEPGTLTPQSPAPDRPAT